MQMQPVLYSDLVDNSVEPVLDLHDLCVSVWILNSFF